MTGVRLGNVVPLVLQLEDGATGLFPQVEVHDPAGAAVAGSPFDLTHEADGRYASNALVMTADAFLKATYIVYTDAPHTTESLDHLRSMDVFSLEDSLSPDGTANIAQGIFALDDSTMIFYAELWLERNAVFVPDGDLVSCSITVYDKDGTALFTVASAATDGNGRFSLERAGTTLLADRPYVVEVTVTDSTGAVVTNHAFTAVS